MFLVILLFNLTGTFGQNERISVAIYENEIEKELLGKSGSIDNISSDLIYGVQKELPADSRLVIVNKVYKRVHDEELKRQLIHIGKPDFKDEVVYYNSGDRYFAQIKTPIFKLSDNGNINILKSFELEQIKEINGAVKQNKEAEWRDESVLKEGDWVKVAVVKSGVYRIPYSKIKEYVDGEINTLAVFGSNSKQLSFYNSDTRHDDLSNISIHVNKGNDNVFNEGDYVLFFGQATSGWDFDAENETYSHYTHDYSDTAFYFININGTLPNQIETRTIIEEADYSSATGDFLFYHELNDTNLLKSGRQFFGELFESKNNFTYPVKVEGVQTETAYFKLQTAARAGEESVFSVNLNGYKIGENKHQSVNLSGQTSRFADLETNTFEFVPSAEELKFNISYNQPSLSKAWLDYFEIHARIKLSFGTDQLIFSDHKSLNSNGFASYSVGNASTCMVWDVTNSLNPTALNYNIDGQFLQYTDKTDTLRKYVVFNENVVYEPEYLGLVENQNLHAEQVPDYLIISHPFFLDEANELAEYRRVHDNLQVFVTTPNKIYNEFSSGIPDISAIRNFIKLFYDRSSESQRLKYVLLLGDGSFNNKLNSENNSNYILTYQSDNSLYPTSSFVTDDFFALLDDNEGGSEGLVDIGIGRFPVQTKNEVRNILDKIYAYESLNNSGEWRNKLFFVADDADDNQVLHMRDADSLTRYVNTFNPEFNIKKVYMDAYPQVSTSGGERYPDVNKAINENVENGVLIFNYTGHGGEEGLADENIVSMSDVLSWSNKSNMPIFVTATCEFSRFDDKNRTSAGEHVLLNPNGGGVALLSTTRLVYTGPNFRLNRAFYQSVFTRDDQGNPLRLGDIMKLTKVNAGNDDNKRNFTLLGDPAIRLPINQYKVKTTELIDVESQKLADTLSSGQEVQVSGEIVDFEGVMVDSFNGEIIVSIYDKPISVTSLSNDGAPAFDFQTQESIVFNGRAKVENGQFSISFRVPKDINYRFGNGKISYYAVDSEMIANGSYSDFIIGGSGNNNYIDNIGPQLKLFLNDTLFTENETVGENPMLIVKVNDESGVNTSGAGIGHEMIAVIDDNNSTPFILNNYYKAEAGNYKSGIIEYPMFGLEEGEHVITVKVWDAFNNSSEASIEFIVGNSNETISKVLLYPNPAHEILSVVINHNLESEIKEIKLSMFTETGQLINERVYEVNDYDYSITMESLPLSDFFEKNITSGIYFLKLQIRSSDNINLDKTVRILIF